MVAVDLALSQLEVPELDGVRLDKVIAAGELLPGMSALWGEATVEERLDMVMLILQPEGCTTTWMSRRSPSSRHARVTAVLRLLEGVVENEEAIEIS